MHQKVWLWSCTRENKPITATQVAKELGISPLTVQKRAQKALQDGVPGVERIGQYFVARPETWASLLQDVRELHRASTDEVAKVTELARDGCTVREIAEASSIDEARVRRILARQGVEFTRERERTVQRVSEAIPVLSEAGLLSDHRRAYLEAYVETRSMAAAAERCGVSPQCIQQHVKKALRDYRRVLALRERPENALSTPAYNALMRAGVRTKIQVRDRGLDWVKKLPGINRNHVREIWEWANRSVSGGNRGAQ